MQLYVTSDFHIDLGVKRDGSKPRELCFGRPSLAQRKGNFMSEAEWMYVFHLSVQQSLQITVTYKSMHRLSRFSSCLLFRENVPTI